MIADLRRLASPLRALALLSARAALRSRLVLAVAVLLVGSIIVLAVTVTGDGSPRGRMQGFLSWSTELTGLVCCLTTVFLSTRLAWSLRQGHLTQVAAAPVPRGLVPVAWWLGCMAVLAILVGVAHLAIGIGAHAMVRSAEPAAAPDMERVLQSRARVRADPPNLDLLVTRAEQRTQELEQTSRLPEGMTREEANEQILRSLRLKRRSVPQGGRMVWRLKDLEPDPDTKKITLRFRYLAQGAGPAGFALQPKVKGRFIIRPPNSPGYELPGTWGSGEFHDVPAPVETLEGAREVDIIYENVDSQPHVVVFPETGPELLYPSGSFEQNLTRAGLVLLGRLIFLAAVGVVLASLLDGKLAAFITLFFLVLGVGHGFLGDALKPGLFGALDAPILTLLEAVLFVVPDLGRDDLPNLLAMGIEVKGQSLLDALVSDALLRGGGMLGFGAVLFGRSELGSIGR